MLFNSLGFLFVFAPIVFLIYGSTSSQAARQRVSLLASYVFYGAWSVEFAELMLLTTSVDYFTARWIEDAETPRGRKIWLSISLTMNLGALAIFKYWSFFAESVNAIAPRPLAPALHVVLPIGISFYTFESMSYTIDVYRGATRALRRFVDYGHFVTMFPRLVAGPIVRYADMAEQLCAIPRRLSPERAMEAAHFFTLGLVKKVWIADPLASYLVDPRRHGRLGDVPREQRAGGLLDLSRDARRERPRRRLGARPPPGARAARGRARAQHDHRHL